MTFIVGRKGPTLHQEREPCFPILCPVDIGLGYRSSFFFFSGGWTERGDECGTLSQRHSETIHRRRDGSTRVLMKRKRKHGVQWSIRDLHSNGRGRGQRPGEARRAGVGWGRGPAWQRAVPSGLPTLTREAGRCTP